MGLNKQETLAKMQGYRVLNARIQGLVVTDKYVSVTPIMKIHIL